MTVDMMSDEEKVGDDWIRHHPSYRSHKFNSFINTLDSRSDANRARFPRAIGSPREKAAPPTAQKWMVQIPNEGHHESPALFSSEEENDCD